MQKVFRGHERAVIAVWWTSENGQKIRHREEKVIDFLNVDMTGFNFGVPPTPTPTLTPTAIPSLPPPTDPYYEQIVSKVIEQKLKWQEELGVEQGVQKTVDWINGSVPEKSLPEEIIPGTVLAAVSKYDAKKMKVYFYKRIVYSLEGLEDPYVVNNEQTASMLTKNSYNNTVFTQPVRKVSMAIKIVPLAAI